MSERDVYINISRLRNDLSNYCGSAAAAGIPLADMYASEAMWGSNDELIKLAKELNFDLNDYICSYGE